MKNTITFLYSSFLEALVLQTSFFLLLPYQTSPSYVSYLFALKSHKTQAPLHLWTRNKAKKERLWLCFSLLKALSSFSLYIGNHGKRWWGEFEFVVNIIENKAKEGKAGYSKMLVG
ncbi:hypothetical protein HKD37_09G026754 [Glycine soja]